KAVRDIPSQVPFIMCTAYGTIDNAVEAMKFGANDYLVKGEIAMLKELEVKVRKALDHKALVDENRELRAELNRRHEYVGSSKPMEEINKLVSQVADSQSTILVMGESGTGKELIARAIHSKSRRSRNAFVKINCAAMPDTLIESELFGHEKGAFTGALRRTRGKFELADGGTLLLDEIGEMPIATQAKLLRVLQEKEINKIGAESPIRVDVRIVATTNRNLKEEVEKNRFREDLYFRLNVIPVVLPPLRQRKDDIPLLVEHFIKKCNEDNGYLVSGISPDAIDALKKHDWPGNVRELENCVERAVVLTRQGQITPDVFQLSGTVKKEGGALSAGVTIADMEKELIYKTLEACQNNKTRAADMLAISIRTLRNKLNEYEGKSSTEEGEME
ncbi:MAG: sigma-54-dependent Fis family transcriptional regulator, partial [Fibrobacteres bacterium]|nr:sigma-54-dependent Fis family transcriptional regulator [Fibrobacterota bacterium]